MPNNNVQITGLDEFKNALQRMSNVAASDKILSSLEAGATVIQIYAQDNARNKLNKHPLGNLVNNILVKRQGRSVMVGAWGVVYAKIHEFGGVISPRNKKMLSFFVDGARVFAHAVHIPARPYLRPAVDAHLSDINDAIGAAMRGLIEAVIK